MKIEYTTDGMDFHFVTVTSIRKKISKIFYAESKKEVKKKVLNWIEINMSDIPLWKVKIENYTIGWR
jgi:hypothetical protein